MSARVDPVALVEAAYESIDASNAVWLRALADALSGMDAGFGAMAGLFDVSDPTQVRMEVGVSSGTPREAVEAVRDSYAKVPASVRVAMCAFGAGFAAERFAYPDLVSMPGATHMTDIGIAGGFGVVGVDASACGVTVSVPMTAAQLRAAKPIVVQPWRRAASHLATAVRLRARRALARREPDAVLLPSGFVVHATGDAKPATPRGELGAAARRMDRARTRTGRADPERALELWHALVSGRWSLVDTIESDGKRILVAYRNETPGVGGAALTSRESQVAALVAGGRSNKEIAYELGIGLSTVETLVLRARRKLGAASRAALAAGMSGR